MTVHADAEAGQIPARVWEKIVPTADDRELMRTAVRLLARGESVTMNLIAGTAGLLEPDPDAIAVGADIERDSADRIVGWGLTLNQTPHRFIVEGREYYTWCALDALVFPAVVETAVQVESTCPVTGETVRLEIDPDTEEIAVDPPAAMVAYVDPKTVTHGRVRSTCCEPQRFLAGPEAGRRWRDSHPGMTVLPVVEAYAGSAYALDD